MALNYPSLSSPIGFPNQIVVFIWPCSKKMIQLNNSKISQLLLNKLPGSLQDWNDWKRDQLTTRAGAIYESEGHRTVPSSDSKKWFQFRNFVASQPKHLAQFGCGGLLGCCNFICVSSLKYKGRRRIQTLEAPSYL